MKGSVSRDKRKDRWVVSWYQDGKVHKIRKYKGEPLETRRLAEKLLSTIQGRYEQYEQGLCTFTIEEFKGGGWTDVAEFWDEWMTEVIEPNRKPWTVYGYQSYWRNWLEPFFQKHQVRLHEIQLNTLVKLKNSITLTGKGKHNVMSALRSMLDYAYRSNRIPRIPPFPKKSEYDIQEPEFKWLSEVDQMEVINAIPEADRAPILWLKYHFRRPSEACALMWKDWDEVNQVFCIRRAFSRGQLVESTKTMAIHYVPCDPEFLPIMQQLKRGDLVDFIFTNHRAVNAGKHYTVRSLENVWNEACELDITLYQGTKHSSCTQFINEHDGTDSELQMLTDHARLDSVKKYRKIGVDRKRKLMMRGRDLKLVKKKAEVK